ncbi:unnamed protein product [Protopolystoma xenopodis]|uniref:Uncharacterized protein n=1 Tax=Protopolystoma xenopodis TaxID=117903 RepID=A0A3S5A2W5_9PLAT|nr:unnamed protein product [Protopolystoma xenopodis]
MERLLQPIHVTHFLPTPEQLAQFGPGGVAIVDQLICSYAR